MHHNRDRARLWPAAPEIGLADEKTAFGLLSGHEPGQTKVKIPVPNGLP